MSDIENREPVGITSGTCRRLLAQTAEEEVRWGCTEKTVVIRALIAASAQLSIASKRFTTMARSEQEIIAAEFESRHAIYLSCDLLDWAVLLLVNPGSGYPVGHPQWIATKLSASSKHVLESDICDVATARGIFDEAAQSLPRFMEETWIQPREPRASRFVSELIDALQYDDDFANACVLAFRRAG